MRYLKVTDYLPMRTHECEDAAFSVRFRVMSIYLSKDKKKLTYINLKSWYKQGYFDDSMLDQLVDEGIISLDERNSIKRNDGYDL